MIDRRTLIQSAPVAVLAVGASAGNNDPHPGWLNRWHEIRRDLNATVGAIDDNDPRWKPYHELERLIASTPATTIEGAAAQAELAAHPEFGITHATSTDTDCVLLRTLSRTLQAMSGIEVAAIQPEQDERQEASDRAAYFASVLGKEPPARLLSDDGAPSPELMAFCDDTGMSLDWVFTGDLKPMVLASHRNRRTA